MCGGRSNVHSKVSNLKLTLNECETTWRLFSFSRRNTSFTISFLSLLSLVLPYFQHTGSLSRKMKLITTLISAILYYLLFFATPNSVDAAPTSPPLESRQSSNCRIVFFDDAAAKLPLNYEPAGAWTHLNNQGSTVKMGTLSYTGTPNGWVLPGYIMKSRNTEDLSKMLIFQHGHNLCSFPTWYDYLRQCNSLVYKQERQRSIQCVHRTDSHRKLYTYMPPSLDVFIYWYTPLVRPQGTGDQYTSACQETSTQRVFYRQK